MTSTVLAGDLAHIEAALPDRRRFAGATILVTGCAGFLGFMFLQFLVRRAAGLGVRRVIGLENFLLGRPRWCDALAGEFPDILKLHWFDIAKDPIGDIAGAREARFVIHLASIASPTFYRRYPIETVDANVWGLRRLLEFYKGSTALEGLLFLSSSEIYGDPDAAHIPTDEDYRGNVACTGPRACYDEAKRFGETLCYVFANAHDMPITVARPFNNYGPGMRLDDRRLPADLARCIIEGRDIAILSDGTPTRTFCYVSDAVAGYLLCLLHGRFGTFNIGADQPEISVRAFAEAFRAAGAALTGYTGSVRHETSDDPHYLSDNPNRRCPAIRRAREMLGYAPTIPVEEGVRRYLAFLRDDAG